MHIYGCIPNFISRKRNISVINVLFLQNIHVILLIYVYFFIFAESFFSIEFSERNVIIIDVTVNRS